MPLARLIAQANALELEAWWKRHEGKPPQLIAVCHHCEHPKPGTLDWKCCLCDTLIPAAQSRLTERPRQWLAL